VRSASGPSDCEDDPDAIGPDQRVYLSEHGEVWRDYTMVMEPGWYEVYMAPEVALGRVTCALRCEYGGTGISGTPPGLQSTEPGYTNTAGPVRVEVRAALADLPTDAPGGFTMSQSAPP